MAGPMQKGIRSRVPHQRFLLMKQAVKKIFFYLRTPIDWIMAALVFLTSPLLKAFVKIGPAQLPVTRQLFKRLGVFPIPNHYYHPLFDDRQLGKSLREDRPLPGLDMNEAGQLKLLDNLTHAEELAALDLNRQRADDPHAFRFGNGQFESGDAEFLYQIIRTTKPARMIEVGSGQSTKIAKLAFDANQKDGAPTASHICIEPYENPWLEALGVHVERRRVEDCPADLFGQLDKGDLLFIDSSHIIRPQGDVLFEFLTLLPRLKSGVLIHVHDVFTPKDYLDDWVRDYVYFWNEQYIMEALLTHSSRFRVKAALNFLMHHHYDRLKTVCPYLDESREPGSFYFEVI